MKSITLIGYMCVGKTTIGRGLARALGLRFYDLDWYIEERFRTPVSRIFAERGEGAFRDLERRMLHEAAAFEDVVLSCGGGTPCFGDNMDFIKENSLSIYLCATPDVIEEHLKMSRTERPLLKGLSGAELRLHVEKQLAEREPHYLRADIVQPINVLGTPEKVDGVVGQLITRINDYRNGKVED